MNYIVLTGDGTTLCDGVSDYKIERVAQAWADRLAKTVYYSESGSEDDEDIAVEPRTVRCECGRYTGGRCQWIGSPDDTVLVEYVPVSYRASHAAAGNAIRVRCKRSCAESIVKNDADWAWIVG